MKTDLVKISRNEDVIQFILNNTENENEITGDMFDNMMAIMKQEMTSQTAKVLHIKANGNVFCTGRERAGKTPSSIRFEAERLVRFKQTLRELPLITVAEVQGDAQGFGFGMAIVCDFVFVSKAAKLGFPEMNMNLAPVAIMSYLSEYILPRHAFQLVLTGESITPAKALEIGLISRVIEAEKLPETTADFIESVRKFDSKALQNCKEFFQTSLKGSFEQNAILAIDALTLGSLEILEK